MPLIRPRPMTASCYQEFDLHHGRKYCSWECGVTRARAPAVYRFVSPDGRSYVGSVKDCRTRAKSGIRRSNSRLKAAYEQYPPGSSELALRKAEQKHINRLRSWSPECGFNILTAVKGRRGPAQRAQLQFRRAVIAGVHEKTRQRVAQYRDACWAQMHHAG